MLDWNQQEEASPLVPAQQTSEGPYYPPPPRACIVCDQQCWHWNGTTYECGSNDPEHLLRATQPWIFVTQKDKEE